MHRELAFALLAFLAASLTAGQQTTSLTPPPSAQTIYYAGSGVTAPQLLPSAISVSSPRHCNEHDGMVKLSAVVDANGRPQNIGLPSQDTGLGNFARGLFATQRFKPGTYNSVPVPVAIEATLGLQTCWRPTRGADSNDADELTLRSHPSIAIDILAPPSALPENANSAPANGPELSAGSVPGVYKVGGRISAPTLMNVVNAEYSEYGRKNRIEGICVIGSIVDVNGMPQKVHVLKSLEPSLDDNAIDAVKQYRFKPAMKDGTTPVPVEITVEVDFHLVKRKLF